MRRLKKGVVGRPQRSNKYKCECGNIFNSKKALCCVKCTKCGSKKFTLLKLNHIN